MHASGPLRSSENTPSTHLKHPSCQKKHLQCVTKHLSARSFINICTQSLGGYCTLQGFLKTGLVVSSFHVLPKEDSEEPGAAFVRIFYGEGDRYGCWLDINKETIVWHEVPPARISRRETKDIRHQRLAPF